MPTRRASSKFWIANYGKPCVNRDIVSCQWYPGLTGNQIKVHAGTEQLWKALGAVMLAYNYKIPTSYVGAYSCRQVTNGSSWSGHAWPLAMDINAKTNPYISHKPIIRTIKWGRETDMPAAMVREAEQITASGKQAFWWGGRYRTIKDAMHYEINVTLADIAGGVHAPRGFYGGGGTAPGDDEMSLKRGDEGHGVAEMQKAFADHWDYDNGNFTPLNAKSIYDGKAFKAGEDGDFGATSEGNVKRFQRNMGFEETGIFDGVTSAMVYAPYGTGGGGVGKHGHPATAVVTEGTKVAVTIGETG